MTNHDEHSTNKHAGSDRPYDVGYGKPPQHTRFRKGFSGNPKGGSRKKHHFDVSDWQNPFVKFLLEPMQMTVKGKRCQIRAYEVWIRRVIHDALSGDPDSSMILLEQSDCLRVLIDPDHREASLADLAHIEGVRRQAASFRVDLSTEADEPDGGGGRRG
ncbi:DUF5681 domain-containing protein [Bradyrhizobium sp. 62]|uniref:DUF5681 domain-containing protein n=1 Tax=Bradyrhizobium sp. 62 TaxID=1043588 RepID=UPI001FF9C44D|nr:DUF5681 domain-containing protein [Bradyrhizobium sp. 62]MCK1364172.1 hypothetical protein [Bradyrhizobium sp. 62]